MFSYYEYPYQSDSYNMQPAMLYPYVQYPLIPSISTPQPQQPILSNRPTEIRLTAFKELTGYPSYGNPSSNADILYTGNAGQWTLLIPRTNSKYFKYWNE